MKFRLLPLLFTLPLLLIACKDEPQGPTMSQYSLLRYENDSLRSHIADMQDAIGQISLSLDSIDLQEGMLFVQNADGTKASRRQILERIRNYRELLVRQRDQIAEMEKNNNAAMQQLRGVIGRLKNEILEKEAKIAALESDLDQKKGNIARLQTDLTQTRQTVSRTVSQRDSLQEVSTQQEDLLNTAYYVTGKKSQLKNWGFLKGTFRTTVDYNSLRKDKFRTIDIRQMTEFTINGTHLKIYPDRPADSYLIYTNADGSSMVTITDTKRFWAASSYLIIQYK